jgi:hypothetical protein
MTFETNFCGAAIIGSGLESCLFVSKVSQEEEPLIVSQAVSCVNEGAQQFKNFGL